LIYQLLLAKLTHFNWQRGYLLASILFSLSLPFIPRFTNWLPSFFTSDSLPSATFIEPLILNPISATSNNIDFIGGIETVDLMAMLGGLLAIIYFTGVILKTLFFIDKLSVIRQLVVSNAKEKVGKEWLIKLSKKGTAFSFLHYIFLTESITALSAEEVTQIIAHEKIHSQQKHSFDIILVEIAEIVLWFHPATYWIKNTLKDIHEYLVDEAMIKEKGTKRSYAQLLLKLSSPMTINSLTTGFSNKQIGRRISMLAKHPSASYHKLKFLLMLPIITSLLLFSACFGEVDQTLSIPANDQTPEIIEQNTDKTTFKIGTITWEGNTVFTDKELNEALQLKTGDVCDKELLEQRLNWDGKGTDVSSLYINSGYAYFSIEVVKMSKGNYIISETPKGNGVIDFVFKLFEGVEVSIANVSISGNKQIPTAELMSIINIKEGEKFSRSKIITAQKALLEMGKFDPEQIGINTPILPENNQLMNIEFSVVELK